jgi:glucose dehydrogenase
MAAASVATERAPSPQVSPRPDAPWRTGFGAAGEVKIDAGMPFVWSGEISMNSPVAQGIVVVGSSIADNVRVKAPRGTVWGLDACTGALDLGPARSRRD